MGSITILFAKVDKNYLEFQNIDIHLIQKDRMGSRTFPHKFDGIQDPKLTEHLLR